MMRKMDKKPLRLLIVEGDKMLAQKFFTRKRNMEKIKFEFTGGVAAFVASYNPRENALVLFVEQIEKVKQALKEDE